MSRDRFLSFLALARKANRLKTGFDPTVGAVSRGEAALVLLAEDLSGKTEKRLRLKCSRSGEAVPPIRRIPRAMADLAAVLGRETGIVAVLDTGFAGKLQSMLREVQ